VTEHLVHDERVKLQAAGLNGLAIVCFATGVVQNIFVFAVGSMRGEVDGLNPAIALFFVFSGVILHLAASYVLGALKEKES
jgi:uncharacterized membrane protein